jgi:hypothetical protein
MRKPLLFIICICYGFVTNLYAQDEKDLNQLMKLDSVFFKDYKPVNIKQVPKTVSVKTYGELGSFTKCLDGYIALLPLSELESKNSKNILKEYVNLNITYLRDPQSPWKLIIVIYSSTGANVGGSALRNIGYCENEAELKAGGGIHIGNCENVKALISGKIFLVNAKDKALIFSGDIYASGVNLDQSIKEFVTEANRTFLEWTKQ